MPSTSEERKSSKRGSAWPPHSPQSDPHTLVGFGHDFVSGCGIRPAANLAIMTERKVDMVRVPRCVGQAGTCAVHAVHITDGQAQAQHCLHEQSGRVLQPGGRLWPGRVERVPQAGKLSTNCAVLHDAHVFAASLRCMLMLSQNTGQERSIHIRARCRCNPGDAWRKEVYQRDGGMLRGLSVSAAVGMQLCLYLSLLFAGSLPLAAGKHQVNAGGQRG